MSQEGSMNEKKTKAQVSGVFKSNGQTVKVSVPVILFKEEETFIAYCPSLNVYGYGDDEEGAKESFEYCLSEFFQYTLNKKTLISELESLGWVVKRKKKFIPPTFSSLLDSNADFRDIFNNREFTKLDQGVAIPVPA